jgi:DNA-binding transcriptional ArsR family regulator
MLVKQMDAINLEQKQREEARWRILRVLDAGRPIAVSETIVWRVLADLKLTLTLNTLRRELSYLRDLGLVELDGERDETWYAKLTAQGVDVVEYTTPAPAGIARPRKYW